MQYFYYQNLPYDLHENNNVFNMQTKINVTERNVDQIIKEFTSFAYSSLLLHISAKYAPRPNMVPAEVPARLSLNPPVVIPIAPSGEVPWKR